MMNDADKRITHAQEISRQLGEVSADANQVMLESSERLSRMENHMEIISDVVDESVKTVQELQPNTSEIISPAIIVL